MVLGHCFTYFCRLSQGSGVYEKTRNLLPLTQSAYTITLDAKTLASDPCARSQPLSPKSYRTAGGNLLRSFQLHLVAAKHHGHMPSEHIPHVLVRNPGSSLRGSEEQVANCAPYRICARDSIGDCPLCLAFAFASQEPSTCSVTSLSPRLSHQCEFVSCRYCPALEAVVAFEPWAHRLRSQQHVHVAVIVSRVAVV